MSAYQPIQYQGRPHIIKPLLVTGLKCWHLRPESKFFPKYNFWNVIKNGSFATDYLSKFNSTARFACSITVWRNRLPRRICSRRPKVHLRSKRVSENRCSQLQDIEEGCLVAINIYIKALLEVIAKYNYTIYVHPAVPVIDITRSASSLLLSLIPHPETL